MQKKDVNQRGEYLPAGVTDLTSNESWLEDRAREGWLAVEINCWGRVLFRKGEPTKTARYRFQILRANREEKPSEEQMELNQEFGWHYLGTVPHYYHLWCTTDPAAPELDTEPTLQAEDYEKMLRRELWSTGVWPLGIPLITIGLIVWMAAANQGRYLIHMARSAMPGSLVFMVLLLISEFVVFWLRYYPLKQEIRRLRAGVPQERPTRYQQKKRRTLIYNRIVTVLVVVLILGQKLGSPRTVGTQSGTRPPAETVYLDLSVLEDGPIQQSDRDYHTQTKVYELVPRLWFVHQSADYPDGGRSDLDTEYFHAWTAGLAERLAWELAEEYQWSDGAQYELIPVKLGMLDGFWWVSIPDEESSSGTAQRAVALLGENVMGLRYRGNADLREHADSIAQLMQETL